MAENRSLNGGEGKAAFVEWRSATIRRACRSTFEAEFMSAVDALGAAIVMRASVLNIFHPNMTLAEIDPSLCPIRSVTDCTSPCDTIHREAVKIPAERRLVLDQGELLEHEICEEVAAATKSKSRQPSGRRRSNGIFLPSSKKPSSLRGGVPSPSPP